MKPILYAKTAAERAAYVQAYAAQLAPQVTAITYLVPKKFLDEARRHLPAARFLCYEDITKRNDVFNLANDQTLLVLDRVARYKNITTDTFVRLSRAANRYQHKLLVDSVPFTGGVEYLYCPLALVDRGILGYQHWYSFRENNWEVTATGAQVRAHDMALLARKVRAHAALRYADFFSNPLETIACPLDAPERREYQAFRDHLFATRATAGPIVTMLADWTNIQASRYAALRDLLARQTGNVAVYTNLSGHNRRLKKLFPDLTVKSFYDANGTEDQYDVVILGELPITKSYLFLDVIAGLRPDCRVYCLRSDTTVDTLLYTRMATEYASITTFIRHLGCEENR